VAVGLADEQKMPAAGHDRLAQRLIGIEIVAQIDRIEPFDALAMGDEPTARGATFAILFVGAPEKPARSRW
jgi:hypothetical protein